MKKERIFIILLILILLIIGITLNVRNAIKKDDEKKEIQESISKEDKKYFIEYGDGNRQNVSDKIMEKRTFEDLDIVNARILYSENDCKMTLDIENNTDKKTDDIMIKVNILDDNNNNIITLNGFIAEVSPGQSTVVNMNSEFDFSNAYDYEIIRK